jgi:1-pyrroline-5-carboxylate dehydrogenase
MHHSRKPTKEPAPQPPPRHRRCARGHSGPCPGRDRCREAGAAQLGLVVVRRPRRRHSSRRRPSHHEVPRGHQRRDDARPVEDGAPGRDRRGVRARRLLPVQRALRPGIASEQPLSSAGMWNMPSYRPLEGFVFAIDALQLHAIAATCRPRPRSWATPSCGSPRTRGDSQRLGHRELLREAGLPHGVINLVNGPRGDHGRVPRSPGSRGRALHGLDRRLPEMWKRVGDNIASTARTRASSARPAARTSSSPPERRRRGARRAIVAARSSTRARSARRRRASTCRSSLWPRSGRSSSPIVRRSRSATSRLHELHGRGHRASARRAARGAHRPREERRRVLARRGRLDRPVERLFRRADARRDRRSEARADEARSSSARCSRVGLPTARRTSARACVDTTSPYALTGAMFARGSPRPREASRSASAALGGQLLHQRQAHGRGRRAAALRRRARRRARTTRRAARST